MIRILDSSSCPSVPRTAMLWPPELVNGSLALCTPSNHARPTKGKKCLIHLMVARPWTGTHQLTLDGNLLLICEGAFHASDLTGSTTKCLPHAAGNNRIMDGSRRHEIARHLILRIPVTTPPRRCSQNQHARPALHVNFWEQ